MLIAALAFVTAASVQAESAVDGRYLTYDNHPMGTTEQPLVLRTFVRNLDLDKSVMSRHATGTKSPKYSPKNGRLDPKSHYGTLSGIPGTISVNLGRTLSYAWDTTECRLLYGWADGFLDMTPYWGTPKNGRRKSYGYSPYFVGHLFYKAKGAHPLRINGQALPSDMRYDGHSRDKGHPVFRVKAGESMISVRIAPGDMPQTMVVHYTSSNRKDKLGYEDTSTPFEIMESGKGRLSVLIRPNSAEIHTGAKEEKIHIETPTADIGAKLYQSYGCAACHSSDGAKGHGPSFKGTFGSMRTFEDGAAAKADENYLRESILKPAAKSVKGFPVGMMPPYQLDDKQVDSLILFIKSLK